jgi:dTDP-D-glucose 4,6-dehydratase
VTKIQTELGFTPPKETFESGIQETLNWYI